MILISYKNSKKKIIILEISNNKSLKIMVKIESLDITFDFENKSDNIIEDLENDNGQQCSNFKSFIFNKEDLIASLYTLSSTNWCNYTIVYNNMGLLFKTKVYLAKRFEIKDLKEIHYILSKQVVRDWRKHIIYLSQQKYLKNILKRFDIEDYKPLIISLDSNIKLLRKMSP